MTVFNAPTPVPTPPMRGAKTPASDIRIRPAALKDVPAVAHLGATLFTKFFGEPIPPKDLAQYLSDAYSHSAVINDFQNPNMDTIVAVDGADTVLGFAQLTRGTTEPCLEGKENFCEFQRLYVAENQHGKGIGSRLMERIYEKAREQGFKGMWIGVWEENTNAQRLYQRQGFQKVGTHDMVNGEFVATDWVMWKDL